MRYKVKSAFMDANTRKLIRLHEEIIDTEKNKAFSDCNCSYLIEKIYEAKWNCLTTKEEVKVINTERIM